MNLTFFRDKEFFRAMLTIALPLAFQQLITAGLNMIDVLMVGQLGETAVAALGLANQIFFLLILFIFGVTSGMSILTAQFWGKGDTEQIRHVLGICLSRKWIHDLVNFTGNQETTSLSNPRSAS